MMIGATSGHIQLPGGRVVLGFVHDVYLYCDRDIEWWQGSVRLLPGAWKLLDLVGGCVVYYDGHTIEDARITRIVAEYDLPTEVEFTTKPAETRR